MKKQELIKHIERLPYESGPIVDKIKISRKGLVNLIEQLDEPKKATVPQFVADWIEYCKNTFLSLVRALMVEEVDFYNYANQKDDLKLKEFFETENNQEIFARAWLDGYEIEKEKRYIVKVKGADEGHNYLNRRISSESWFFSGESELLDFRVKHTRKELEKASFGWIFDCKGIEVKEVKE